jgi:hypothetical protein
MNDDEVITLVREQRDKVTMTIPVEEIIRRGRVVRTRRLIPGVAGVLAVLVGAAIAMSALAPASHKANPQRSDQARHQSTARLAAWTVAKLADGNISVTVRQLQDPGGLQSTLRADGVPASVTFAEQQNPACHTYPGGTLGSPGEPPTPLLKDVFPQPYQSLPTQAPGAPTPATGAPTPPPPNPGSTIIVLDPSALPSDAGVQLGASPSGSAVLLPQVVHASSQCTGS